MSKETAGDVVRRKLLDLVVCPVCLLEVPGKQIEAEPPRGQFIGCDSCWEKYQEEFRKITVPALRRALNRSFLTHVEGTAKTKRNPMVNK